jgi:hypothetical protein
MAQNWTCNLAKYPEEEEVSNFARWPPPRGADHSTKRPGRVGACQTRAQVAPILKRNPLQAALRSLTVAEAVHVGPDSANGCGLWISQPRSKCLTFPRKPYGTLPIVLPLPYISKYISKLTGLSAGEHPDASERCTLPMSNEQSLSDTPRAPSIYNSL